MKVKDLKTSFLKFNAWIETERKNESQYYDKQRYVLIYGDVKIEVERPEQFPSDYMNLEISDFNVEIVLGKQAGVTSFNNYYRPQSKTIYIYI